MAGFNRVEIIGNVGRDAEMRYLPTGDAVTNFSVAVGYKKKDGETQTEWFDVSCFRQLAEIANNYVVKGKQVFVSGKVSLNLYQANDGTTRASMRLAATELVLLGSKDDVPGGGAAKPAETSEAEPSSLDQMPF